MQPEIVKTDEELDHEKYEYEEITADEYIQRYGSNNEINHIIRSKFAVNIHYMLSEQTYDRAFKIIDEIKSDERLARMNAIVFLQYKHKNPKSPFTSMLDKDKYRKLVQYCEDKGVAFGFDSCSANLFLDSVKGMDNYKMYEVVCEPCESTAFSSYINCHGEFSPCSFCEEMTFDGQDWNKGISVFEVEKFTDVWKHPKVVNFRENLLKNCRNCPIYDI